MRRLWFLHHKSDQGLTLIELMTVLFILILLAMVGFPVYQEYQNRANLAEAESVLGTTERHLRTYFMDHGSFYSATPTPASVPGLGSVGSTSTFTPVGGWTTIGSPVPGGSNVNFSYQSFAGQTPSGTTTPTVNGYLYNPTDDMNLIRRTSNASNYHFPSAVRVASNDEQLRLDWSEFNLCAQAQGTYASCYAGCYHDGQVCVDSCTAKFGAPTGTAADQCVSACEAAGASPNDCNLKCQESGNGSCSGAIEDVDCYTDASTPQTAEQNCVSACIGIGKNPDDCNYVCSQSDGKCSSPDNPYGDPDCYHATQGGNQTQACYDGCMYAGARDHDACQKYCSVPPDGKCGGDSLGIASDIDCYQSNSCVDKCASAGVEINKCYMTCNDPTQQSCEQRCTSELAASGIAVIGGEKESRLADCITACNAPPPDPCANGGCGDPTGYYGGGGGGYSGGGNAGGGSSSGGGGSYSGGGSTTASGGTSSGSGTTSTSSGGTVTTSNNECASFGITKPTDFGILQNVSNYNWAVMTAVGNFTPGSACTLVAKVLQVRDGNPTQSEFIRINPGE